VGDAREPRARPDPTAPSAPPARPKAPAPPAAPARTLGDPAPLTAKRQARHRELFADPATEQPFLDRLRAFRGNENAWPPDGFSGGEGQLFHSDREPGLALKRWYTGRVTDKKDSPGKPTSVRLLRDAAKLVDGNPELAKHLEVVRVHDEGPDWILRDFDRRSSEVSDLESPNRRAFDQAVAESVRILRTMQKTQPQNQALSALLGRLSSLPPSVNVHWSPVRGKLLIIDLM
jgi:hypothetical protein